MQYKNITVICPESMSYEEVIQYVEEEIAIWAKVGKRISEIKIDIDSDGWLKIEAKERSPITRTRRITGYCSNISNFNDAKISELKDRQKHMKGA